ncbi:hypothetical protein B0H16DRAFT_1602496, partial [Mycena metata]
LQATIAKLEQDRVLVEEYSRLCQGILSPIRRLPTEILTQIFAFFVPNLGVYRSSNGLGYEEGRQEELSRVANADLLRISQVCLRWHALVMGTPSLWSVIDLDLALWDGIAEAPIKRALKSALDRGGNSALYVGLRCRGFCGPPALELLRLLAQHSRRWRKLVVLECESIPMAAISLLKTSFPLLHTLDMDVIFSDDTDASELMSCFNVAPRLHTLEYLGPFKCLLKLPLEQLYTIQCLEVLISDFDEFIAVLKRLSRTTSDCRLHLEIDSDTAIDGLPITTTATCNISGRLLFWISNPNGADGGGTVLACLMSRLTLPFIQVLQFAARGRQHLVTRWPHVEFSALSDRSSFSGHLLSLKLAAILITELELVQTLSGLNSLQALTISDHRIIKGKGQESVLFTDSLLRRLAWSHDSTCLVPHLSVLKCHTLLKFDDSVHRDFVLSRLESGRSPEDPFQVDLRWYPGHYRELDSEVVAEFAERETQGELYFSLSESTLFSQAE